MMRLGVCCSVGVWLWVGRMMYYNQTVDDEDDGDDERGKGEQRKRNINSFIDVEGMWEVSRHGESVANAMAVGSA